MLQKFFASFLIVSLFRTSFCQSQEIRNFSFLTGSCAYVSPEIGDTSQFLLRGDTSIFYTLSKMPADFMLWLGDNWYMSEEETRSPEGLRAKARYAMHVATLQPLLNRSFPQYAIWDDHDYGPDEGQKNFRWKETSRDLFKQTWGDNPGYGEHEKGIYTAFRFADVQFILLDDRWWRDYDSRWSYLFVFANPWKRMFGKQQMRWLKKTLLEDTAARFHIIVNGSQMLNPLAKEDCFVRFPIEYKSLLKFLKRERIRGVLFLSGDRHFSEIIRLERGLLYPLYDVTVSPFSSTPSLLRGREIENPFRVPGSHIGTYNFARWSFSGTGAERTLTVSFFDRVGTLLNSWSVKASQLQPAQ